jgi:hypothetical protein
MNEKITEMSHNSSPFSQETAEFRSVAVAHGLTRSEQAAAVSAAMPIASDREVEEFSWSLVEILAETDAGATSKHRGAVLKARIAKIFGRPDLAWRSRLAAAGLAERWADLPAPVRTTALTFGRSLLRALIAEGTVLRCRRSAARLIADLREAALAAHLAPMVLDFQADIAAAAEESLVQLAAAAIDAEDDELAGTAWIPAAAADHPWSASDRRELHTQVALLLRAYRTHRRGGLFACPLLLLDAASLAWRHSGKDPLTQWFTDGGHESHLAWRAAIKRAPGPTARRRAWQFLGRGVADPACLERLMWARSAEEHSAVLELAHLVSNPARRRMLARPRPGPGAHRHRPAVLPAVHHLQQLSPAARRGVPLLAASLHLSAEAIEEVLAPLAGDDDCSVRLAALAAAPRGGELALALCSDPDLDIARFAGVMQLGDPQTPDPWRVDCERSRLTARVLLDRDRAAFVRRLRARIEHGSEAQRVGAIVLARRLGIVAEFELELLRALARPDGEQTLLATAIAALGEVDSGAASASLAACTAHPVPRVRANAVEAMLRPNWPGLGRTPGAAPGVIFELKADGHHRVRANVLRGVLTAATGPFAAARATARQDLLAMIADERPLHRLAGLWALERVMTAGHRPVAIQPRWNELATQLAEVARREPEEPVRRRAARCARLMLLQMRSDWTGRAAAAAEESAA